MSRNPSHTLGAAMIAAHATGGFPYPKLYDKFSPAASVVEPDPATAGVYAKSLEAFRPFEAQARR